MASILVVDDEPAICSLMTVFLTGEGYWVRTAANGQQALAALARGPLPDLILLDLCMPVMPGRAVLAAVRADRNWRDIPVVVLTASAPGSPEMPLPGTYETLLQKPFDLDELLATVRQHTKPTVDYEAAASC